MYTHYRSLSHVVAFLHAAMLASLILLWCGPHLSLSLSLSLQPHSPILLSSVVDATSLPFSLTLAFSLQPHSPTLLSSVGSTASLCLSSATLTVTLLTRTVHYPHLYLSLSLSLSLQPIMICRTEVSIFPIAAVWNIRFLQHMVHPWDMGLTYILDFLQLPYFDSATVLNIFYAHLCKSYDCCVTW